MKPFTLFVISAKARKMFLFGNAEALR